MPPTMRKAPQSASHAAFASPSPEEDPRSLDEFLEQAYRGAEGGFPWAYWITMFSLGVANSSDASEILCLSYILSDSAFQEEILRDEAWRAGVLAAAVFLGMLLGGLFIGTIGDWVGRHPTLMVGLICNSVAGVLSAAAQNSIQLSFVRCIAGVGIGATVPPLFTLVTELAPPSRRGFFVTFCASFWMVGSIFVALAALVFLDYFKLSWRIFAIVCAIPSAVGAIMVSSLVHESPRFLALQGKQEEALMVANRLARQMRYHGTLLSMLDILHFYPRSSHGNQRPVQTATGCAWVFGILRLAMLDFLNSTSKLYQPQLRPITWPLQTVWFSLSFGSYGILTWINSLFVAVHLENVYFNALLFAFSNLPGNLLSAFFMDRTGRKSMLVVSSLAAALSLVSFAYFASESNNTLNASGIVASACMFQAFTIAAWNTIDCMTSELFPTAVRSTGMGVCAASGRVGAMVAQFVNGALVGNPVRLLLVASMSLVIGAITPCLLPPGDMSMRPLEDTLQRDANVEGEEMDLAHGEGEKDAHTSFDCIQSCDFSYHSTATIESDRMT